MNIEEDLGDLLGHADWYTKRQLINEYERDMPPVEVKLPTGVATMPYDWSEVDKHIMRNRIFKEVDIGEYIEEADKQIEDIRGKLPEPDVDREMLDLGKKLDWKRPWGGNDYMFCPEMYCTAVKRRLECELGQFFENYPDGIPEKPWYTIFPPAEMVPYHDAVFEVDDHPELLDPRPEVKKRNWWDKEAIAAEFNEFDPSAMSAERRVDWYLNHSTLVVGVWGA